jgi:hypothetical protein
LQFCHYVEPPKSIVQIVTILPAAALPAAGTEGG